MLSYGQVNTRYVVVEVVLLVPAIGRRLTPSQNPQTRQVQAGYFITAYRNLTTVILHPQLLFSQLLTLVGTGNDRRSQG